MTPPAYHPTRRSSPSRSMARQAGPSSFSVWRCAAMAGTASPAGCPSSSAPICWRLVAVWPGCGTPGGVMGASTTKPVGVEAACGRRDGLTCKLLLPHPDHQFCWAAGLSSPGAVSEGRHHAHPRPIVSLTQWAASEKEMQTAFSCPRPRPLQPPRRRGLHPGGARLSLVLDRRRRMR
jgi:hypothetical protein